MGNNIKTRGFSRKIFLSFDFISFIPTNLNNSLTLMILMAESEEELKSLLIKVKGEWKSWPKTQHSENEDHHIKSHHFMANRWGNNGNSDILYFLGLQNDYRW